MSSEPSSAKPAVLRCARCGRFVDWGEARLQTICDCKGHITLPPVLVREATGDDRTATLDLFRRDFGQTTLVGFGAVTTLGDLPVLMAEMRDELAGALAYRVLDGALQIVALATDPMWQRSGVAGHLVAEAELLARARKLSRVIVETTNDNLPSLYFYQRRGYQITDVVPGAVERALNRPGVIGFAGIPIRDEIRMAKTLPPSP